MSREYVLRPFETAVNLQIDYAAELNPQQCAAVTAPPGPALVIAGAGSGKTRTLVYRVAFLLEQGIPPDRILLLTFTNKAAKEMMRRVSDLIGGNLTGLWGGTFHSIASRLLRRNAERLGFRRDFTILDREDATDLLRASMDEVEMDITARRPPKADVLADIFSMAVNTGRSIATVLDEHYEQLLPLASEIEDIGKRYLDRKRAGNVMDFDDLLLFWLKMLEEHPDLAELYQRRFQFILVDEYQDTNKVQSDIVDRLAARHHNLMVVGDDSQSIYSWRGAHFQNILQFPERYPEATIYKIETNYRSTPEILATANAAIAPNRLQFAKQLAPTRKSGAKPVLAVCGDAGQQAAFVAQRALELRDEGYSLNDMAVLYRSHFHALELQLELTRRNIPFSITSGVRFFEQAHVKDVLAYLKLVFNPQDELSFKRIVRLLPGVGSKAADNLWKCFSDEIDRVVSGPEAQVRAALAAALQGCTAVVPKRTTVAWAQLSATLAQLETLESNSQASDMIRLVITASYDDYARETFKNYNVRMEDLEQLANFALQFKEVEEFLSELALLTNIDADDDRPENEDDERIRLSTIHQAKGLEFPIVFVIMLCDRLFPSARSLNRPEDEEEERRLFYVAITRAKHELYLSYPLLRLAGAYTGDIMQRPSRFLADIPQDLIETWNLHSYGH